MKKFCSHKHFCQHGWRAPGILVASRVLLPWFRQPLRPLLAGFTFLCYRLARMVPKLYPPNLPWHLFRPSIARRVLPPAFSFTPACYTSQANFRYHCWEAFFQLQVPRQRMSVYRAGIIRAATLCRDAALSPYQPVNDFLHANARKFNILRLRVFNATRRNPAQQHHRRASLPERFATCHRG